ncbi:unnamed protein product [Prunus armeniaca]
MHPSHQLNLIDQAPTQDPSSAFAVTSRDRLCRSTILSALGPPLYPYGFVYRNSRAISQLVTYPGIALAQTHLNSEFT